MNIKEKLSDLKNLKLYYVWTYTFDEGPDNELILDPNCICLEFENHNFLKICTMQGEGKIDVTIEKKMKYSPDMEVPFKIDVRNYILDFPETDYYVEKVGGINIEINQNSMMCEALEICLYTETYGKNKQSIFIYAGMSGLNIGGLNKKNTWIEGLYIPLYGSDIDEKWF